MLILERYTFHKFLRIFLSCFFVFCLLYLVIDIFSNLSDLIQNKPPLLKIIEYYIYSLPQILYHTCPMAILLSTLFSIGSLNQNNEIIAMRANGLPLFQIIRPLLVFTAMLSCSLLLANETIIPQSLKMKRVIKDYYFEKKSAELPDSPLLNVAVYGYNNRLFFISKLHPKSHTIQGLTILEHDDQQNVTTKIYAEKAVWRDNRWVLYQCFIYNMGGNDQIKGEPLYFSDKTIRIEETPEDFFKQNVPIDNMNSRQLTSYIKRLGQSGTSATTQRLMVDVHQKISFPFISMVVLLIGIPPAAVIRRKAATFASIGATIGISFLFYVLFSVGIALGKTGAIPPFLAAWLSHLIFGITALVLIKKIP